MRQVRCDRFQCGAVNPRVLNQAGVLTISAPIGVADFGAQDGEVAAVDTTVDAGVGVAAVNQRILDTEGRRYTVRLPNRTVDLRVADDNASGTYVDIAVDNLGIDNRVRHSDRARARVGREVGARRDTGVVGPREASA